MRDLTRELRVGTCCGKCLPEAKATLSACLARRPSELATPTFFPAGPAEFAT